MGNMYIGVSNISRKVSSIYIGINNIAKKVNKGYIGVNNVARLFYEKEKNWIRGVVNEGMPNQVYYLAAASTENHAIFAGGRYAAGNSFVTSSIGCRYDLSFTRSIIGLGYSAGQFIGTKIGRYAIFGGGYYVPGGAVFDKTVAFDDTSTMLTPPSLTCAVYQLTATSVGGYAIFGGGIGSGTDHTTVYDTNLTSINVSNKIKYESEQTTGTVGNYALFGGGLRRPQTIETYDNNLTYGNTLQFFTARQYMGLHAASNGTHIFFPSGYYNTNYFNTVETFSSSLTHSMATPLSMSGLYSESVSVGDQVLIYNTSENSKLYVYDSSSTQTIIEGLERPSTAYYYGDVTSLQNAALFAGGSDTSLSNTYKSVVYYQYA